MIGDIVALFAAAAYGLYTTVIKVKVSYPVLPFEITLEPHELSRFLKMMESQCSFSSATLVL